MTHSNDVSECRLPVFRYGEAWATRSVGSHDWRLLSREKRYEGGASSFHFENGMRVPTPVGHDEVWYCTRCRKVETVETDA